MASHQIDPRLVLMPPLPHSHRSRAQTRMDDFFQETRALIQLAATNNSLLFTDNKPQHRSEFFKSVKDLLVRLQKWYRDLPSDLAYGKDMPAPYFELHSEYHCTITALCSFENSTEEHGAMQQYDELHATQDLLYRGLISAELEMKCSVHARQLAVLLRDYRQVYGLKGESLMTNYLGLSRHCTF